MTINIERNFSHHPPKDDQLVRYEQIRNYGRAFAALIENFCPDSREKSIAMTKLEECVMWANASIARNE